MSIWIWLLIAHFVGMWIFVIRSFFRDMFDYHADRHPQSILSWTSFSGGKPLPKCQPFEETNFFDIAFITTVEFAGALMFWEITFVISLFKEEK